MKNEIITNLLLHLIINAKFSLAVESFVVDFESPLVWSLEKSMSYKNSISQMNDFTSCHWEKKMYTSTKTSPAWQYCTILNPDDVGNNKKEDLSCVGLHSGDLPVSSTKNTFYYLSLDNVDNKTMNVKFDVKSTYNRVWSHVCIVYSRNWKSVTLYHDGKLIERDKKDSLPKIPGITGGKEAPQSFIVGQQSDAFRTGFTGSNTFFGMISEVNIWDRILDDEEIRDMAERKVFPKGNIISWTYDNFEIKGLKTQNFTDISSHLKNKKQLIIFPKRLLYSVANRLCAAYGGTIVTPESEEENSEVFDVLLKHRGVCLDEFTVTKDPEMGIWLGAQKKDEKWVVPTEDKQMLPLNYSNWKGVRWTDSYDPICATMNIDGKWAAQIRSDDGWMKCNRNQLCTICSYTKPPIFGLKGLCAQGSFQWFYHPIINGSNQIDTYEGYLSAQAIVNQGNEWEGINGDDSIRIPKVKEIVGRNEWTWYEGACTKKDALRNLTLSNCDVDNQFTCDFGDCISITKRCDTVKDCGDGSDEVGCTLADIPESYNRLESPSSSSSSASADVNDSLVVTFGATIETINQIDTHNLVIETTVKLNLTWYDDRLKFRNLPRGREKLVKPTVARDLWIPLNDLVFPNAIIGSFQEDSFFEISTYTNSSPVSHWDVFTDDRENYVFKGEDTKLQINKKARMKTTCNFQFTKFPFDQHTCDVMVCTKETDQGRVRIIPADETFNYVGEKIVSQFTVKKILPVSNDLNIAGCSGDYGLKFSIALERSPQGGIQMIIIPTLICWFVGYLTLFLPMDDLENRGQVSVPVLLILVTLFGSISVKDDYPETTNFKYIDAWFLWYMFDTLIIIAYHILICHVCKRLGVESGEKYGKNSVGPDQMHTMNGVVMEKIHELREKKLRKTNKIVVIVVFVTCFLFNCWYFLVAVSDTLDALDFL